MNARSPSSVGFSLVELLVTLLLVAVLVTFTGFLLAPVIQVFLNAREASALLHESELGMARLSREFTTITNVVSASSSSITYDTLNSSGVAQRRTVSWAGNSGDPLLLNGHVLMGGLRLFGLSYLDSPTANPQSTWGANSSLIEVVLDLGVSGSVYTNRFFPRNIR